MVFSEWRAIRRRARELSLTSEWASWRVGCGDYPTTTARLANSLTRLVFRLESEAFRFAKSLDDGFEWSEYWRRDAGDGSEGHADGATGALRPVGHVQTGNQPADQLTALREQVSRGLMKLLVRNDQITGDQLAVHAAPRGITHRAPLRPDAEVAD